MGGKEGILKLLDSLYACRSDFSCYANRGDDRYQLVASDARIKDFFGDGTLEKIREGQTLVLIELFGGPKVYNGEPSG